MTESFPGCEYVIFAVPVIMPDNAEQGPRLDSYFEPDEQRPPGKALARQGDNEEFGYEIIGTELRAIELGDTATSRVSEANPVREVVAPQRDEPIRAHAIRLDRLGE